MESSRGVRRGRSRRLLIGWLIALAAGGQALAASPLVAAAEPAATPAATPPANSESAAQIELRKVALARAHAAVVGVHATAVEDASSIDSLGRERTGSGVLIGADGLVLTIGYLILEADHIDLAFGDERVVPARVVAYDQASGFGLLQALAPVKTAPAPFGDSTALDTSEPLLIASGGPEGGLSLARMVSHRPFSGYWEYHLDDALFTAPARVDHSGAALFNADGQLVGIGSLVVTDALGPGQPRMPGNMFVPIDRLKPILAELRASGASRDSSRAWLGVTCVEVDGTVNVVKVTPDSPAARAGLQPGDRIVRLNGSDVGSLETLYKTLWRDAPAERDVALEIQRGGEPVAVKARTRDRMSTFRKPQGI